MVNLRKDRCYYGGSRGIGKNTAELSGREGASLALCARNEGPLSDVADQLSTRYGIKVVSQPADI
jgi:3-oxoacyl-[acyl-carrier protein] reductase